MPIRSTNMLFQTVDTNENGVIDYSEFKAAILRSQVYLHEDILRKSFNYFDRDSNGYLTIHELQSVFENFDDLISMFEFNVFDDIINQVDKDRDGKVNYQEFLDMMTREAINLEEEERERNITF